MLLTYSLTCTHDGVFPLQVVAVIAVTLGTLLLPVMSEVPSTCDWLIPSESGCVKNVECKDSGYAIDIYEDCEVNEELFTINDSKYTHIIWVIP